MKILCDYHVKKKDICEGKVCTLSYKFQQQLEDLLAEEEFEEILRDNADYYQGEIDG